MAIFNLPFLDKLRKAIEQIVVLSNVAAASTTLGNGQQAVFTMTTTGSSGARILADTDITIYMDSISAANAFPGGANIDMSQWQMVGPFNDWGATNNINNKSRLFLRNISAGSHTVVFRGQCRLIQNSVSLGSSSA
ncbi:MAG: hypothetical protein PHE73_08795 [Sulfurovaceae bacterium]|nr:hypothetical protein [Sulfurovaceae bacterium]